MKNSLMFVIAVGLMTFAGCASGGRDAAGRCPDVDVLGACPFGHERKCETNSDGCRSCGCEMRPGGFLRPDPNTPPRP